MHLGLYGTDVAACESRYFGVGYQYRLKYGDCRPLASRYFYLFMKNNKDIRCQAGNYDN